MICWIAIALLTFILWCHGNPGGWQFSYRYAMILLPWMFLLLTGNGPPKITVTEISLFAVSVAINATATWLFFGPTKFRSSKNVRLESQHLRVHHCGETRTCLTKKIMRLRFAPMPARSKPDEDGCGW